MDHSTLAGHSILIVESNIDAARYLRRILLGAGAHVVEALEVDAALHAAGARRLSAAVLDYGQSINDRHLLALRLTAFGVPFMFCKDASRNEAWAHAPALNRPIVATELIETLSRLIARTSIEPAIGSEAKRVAGARHGLWIAHRHTD